MKQILCGNKEVFATQFELDIDDCCGSQWMLGKFCFYINNCRVGDPEMGATLRDVKEYLGDYVLYPQCVFAPKLFILNDQEIFNLIYNMFEEGDQKINQYLEKDTKAEYLSIDLSEQFIDPYFIYKVDSDTQTKIFYGECEYIRSSIPMENKSFHSMMFLREQVDSVLKDTYTELQRIHDLLKAKEIEISSK